MMQNSAIRLGTVHPSANMHTGQVGPMPLQKALPRILLLLQTPPLLLLLASILGPPLILFVLTQGMWSHTA